MMIKALLHTDGGSRGNPGLAGIGFTLVGEGGDLLAQGGWCIGRQTNNVAEYSALIWGLENARAAGVTHIAVCADSELVVKQINGAYQVKSADLKPLFMQAKSMLAGFEEARVEHVYREENAAADLLANEAMDKGASVGSYLRAWEARRLSLFDDERQESQQGTALSCGHHEAGKPPSLSDSSALERKPVMEKNHPYEGPGQLSGAHYEDRGRSYELTVKDHFDAAHTLPGYGGPCRYLHGHTWDVEVTLVGQRLDSVGVLYDFKDIKRDLHRVLDNFDHRYINDTPPFDAINPTAENLARVIFYELEKTLPTGISMLSVAIWESPQAKIVYRPS